MPGGLEAWGLEGWVLWRDCGLEALRLGGFEAGFLGGMEAWKLAGLVGLGLGGLGI